MSATVEQITRSVEHSLQDVSAESLLLSPPPSLPGRVPSLPMRGMTREQPPRGDSVQHDCVQKCLHGDGGHVERTESKETVAEPSKQTRGGASRLRQQWAKHKQPKLHESDPLLEGERGREEVGGEGCLSVTERQCMTPSDITTKTTPPCNCARSKLLKTQSVGSISSESLTISSLWEAPSYDTIPDFLSSLGFDDFDSRELIPDRFIPPELDFVRPSLMRQATLGAVSVETVDQPLSSRLSPPPDGLLLGDSAESMTQQQSGGVATEGVASTKPIPPQTLALYLPSHSQLPWQPASLETVVEETGSELLSPRPPSRPPSRQSSRLTPHIHSPLPSIDHTPSQDLPTAGFEGDVSAGLLGAELAQRLRQQVLVREDLRQRQASLGADSDTSSIYFSVGSHFDDGEREVEPGTSRGERELVKEGSVEDVETSCRHHRRGNYVAPPQLLMWLEKTESTDEAPDQPWPFNESPAHSPAPPPPPSITLNGNCSNNSEKVMVCRLEFARRRTFPMATEVTPFTGSLNSTSLSPRQNSRGVLVGSRHHTSSFDCCLTSAYHQASHTPT